VYEVTPDYRRSRAVFGRNPDGTPVYAVQTEILAPEAFLESVAEERKETDGKGWGNDRNGINLVKVASIPLNLWYRDFAGRAEDQDFKKWWLAKAEHAAFRTKRGNL
jgi:hypothetical protein